MFVGSSLFETQRIDQCFGADLFWTWNCRRVKFLGSAPKSVILSVLVCRNHFKYNIRTPVSKRNCKPKSCLISMITKTKGCKYNYTILKNYYLEVHALCVLLCSDLFLCCMVTWRLCSLSSLKDDMFQAHWMGICPAWVMTHHFTSYFSHS